MQALWMLVAAFMFASMGVCVKIASADFSTAELVFYRGLVGMVLLAMLAQHQRVPLRTQYPGMHAWRGMVGVTSMGAWYYAIAHLPLPTAMTFNYMSSLWMSAFLVGAALWRWRPGGPRPSVPLALVGCVLVGFGGVVLLLRPSLHAEQLWGGVIGLVAFYLYGNWELGAVMTGAMTLNLLLAALMGVLIPMTLLRLGRGSNSRTACSRPLTSKAPRSMNSNASPHCARVASETSTVATPLVQPSMRLARFTVSPMAV